jgi:hypothetical protein
MIKNLNGADSDHFMSSDNYFYIEDQFKVYYSLLRRIGHKRLLGLSEQTNKKSVKQIKVKAAFTKTMYT